MIRNPVVDIFSSYMGVLSCRKIAVKLSTEEQPRTVVNARHSLKQLNCDKEISINKQ